MLEKHEELWSDETEYRRGGFAKALGAKLSIEKTSEKWPSLPWSSRAHIPPKGGSSRPQAKMKLMCWFEKGRIHGKKNIAVLGSIHLDIDIYPRNENSTEQKWFPEKWNHSIWFSNKMLLHLQFHSMLTPVPKDRHGRCEHLLCL